MSDFFWFSDAQWARIEPLLPQDTRGKARVDDRRVLSGIVHALKCGGRWADCPREVYGPKKTLYNRFVRWAERGVWEAAGAACASRRASRSSRRRRRCPARTGSWCSSGPAAPPWAPRTSSPSRRTCASGAQHRRATTCATREMPFRRPTPSPPVTTTKPTQQPLPTKKTSATKTKTKTKTKP